MTRKIDWLDNFAESYSKKIEKTASKIQKQSIIVDKNDVGNAKLNDVVNFRGKMYKIADLDYADEQGPGVILDEVEQTPFGDVDTKDPMSVSMGAPAEQFENGQKTQEYARTNTGDVYHYEVRDDVEKTSYENAANETARQIEDERNTDRTTQQGHYTNVTKTDVTIVQEDPTRDINVEPVQDTVDDVVEEDTVEEPIEKKEDELVEEPVQDTADDVVEEDTVEEDTVEEPIEKKEEDLTAMRHNRILRRIMASK